MNDVTQTAPQPNEPQARTETGEIKDQTPPPETTSAASDDTSKTPPPPADTEKKPSLSNEPEQKTETKPEVPEKYEFKAPDGFEYNADKLAAAEGIFKELGLSQDQAQKLMDFAGKEMASAVQSPYDAYQTQRNEWRDGIIKDPTLGNGKDGLLPAVKADISKVVDSLGPQLAAEFREAMDYTGVGDHPAFVKGIKALAAFVTEGRPVSGARPAAPAQAQKSAASAIYPNLPSANG